MDKFISISLSKFKFNIIKKIIVDILANFMSSLASSEQRGFIKGRCIRGCICLAWDGANHLHKKSFGGNFSLKVDISKAFYIISWDFLLYVLRKFGFNDTFCNWIQTTLKYAFLYVSTNGVSHGYFNFSRGFRQGDPLSPLLFCLPEEVLSRSLTKLVEDGILSWSKAPIRFTFLRMLCMHMTS